MPVGAPNSSTTFFDALDAFIYKASRALIFPRRLIAYYLGKN